MEKVKQSMKTTSSVRLVHDTNTYLKCIKYLYHLDFLLLFTMDKSSFILWKLPLLTPLKTISSSQIDLKKNLPNQKIFANNVTLKANVINTEKAITNQ